MIGHSAQEFVFPDDLESTRNEMRLARRGKLSRSFECRYVHRDGHAVPLAWTGIWSEPDRQYFFTGRDMSERIMLEGQLRQAQKMEAVGQLTGGVAHDFNNILTVIIGMTELLTESVGDDPKLAPIVQAIDEAASRGAQLTQRMLAFARKQPLQARNIDLNEIVTAHGRQLLQRTIGEDIAVEDRARRRAVADARRSDADRERDPQPRGQCARRDAERRPADDRDRQRASRRALCGAECRGGGRPLRCGDRSATTGSGMPPEVVERAFEPFFTTKEVGSGTGLGLSKVYGFVKQSRGHVKIYSELGHGTTVKLYLPRADAAETAAAETERPRECAARPAPRPFWWSRTAPRCAT